MLRTSFSQFRAILGIDEAGPVLSVTTFTTISPKIECSARKTDLSPFFLAMLRMLTIE